VRVLKLTSSPSRTRRFQPSINAASNYSEPACLTVEETAAYLRISLHSAYTLCRQGKLPVVHPVPRRTLVVKRKLDEMLMNGTLGTDLSAQDN
jgi:Helix-turn-helix domain